MSNIDITITPNTILVEDIDTGTQQSCPTSAFITNFYYPEIGMLMEGVRWYSDTDPLSLIIEVQPGKSVVVKDKQSFLAKEPYYEIYGVTIDRFTNKFIINSFASPEKIFSLDSKLYLPIRGNIDKKDGSVQTAKTPNSYPQWQWGKKLAVILHEVRQAGMSSLKVSDFPGEDSSSEGTKSLASIINKLAEVNPNDLEQADDIKTVGDLIDLLEKRSSPRSIHEQTFQAFKSTIEIPDYIKAMDSVTVQNLQDMVIDAEGEAVEPDEYQEELYEDEEDFYEEEYSEGHVNYPPVAIESLTVEGVDISTSNVNVTHWTMDWSTTDNNQTNNNSTDGF